MSNERVRGSPRPRGLLSELVVPAEALFGALLVAALVRRLLARAPRRGLVVAFPDTRLRPLLGGADFPAARELARAVHPEPVLSKPGASRPVTGRPPTQRPVTQRPVTQQPVTQRTWAR